MRLSSAARNVASRCGVHASGFTSGTLGSSTPSHGLTMILPGTAAFIAARSTAKARVMRAGDSGLVDFFRRFSPGARCRRSSSARASSMRRSISEGRSPSGCGRLIFIISRTASAT